MDKLKQKVNQLQNKDPKRSILWKPQPGKQVVRIVPYKKTPDWPFIDLKFHYNLNKQTYLSPDTFGRPDPVVEFSNRLKHSKDKEDWKMGKKLEPKVRTYVPIIVRDEEGEGVKFWGFGKKVYQAIVSYMTDPDYGDISDLTSGRDLVVEFHTAEDLGASYPDTVVRPKPNQTPAVDPNNKELIKSISNQPDIMEVFTEPSYDELKDALYAWLHPEETEEEVSPVAPLTEVTEPVEVKSEISSTKEEVDQKPTAQQARLVTKSSTNDVKSPSAEKAKIAASSPPLVKEDEIAKAFDNLFSN